MERTFWRFSNVLTVCFPYEARLVILLILTVGSQSKLPKEWPSLRRAEDSVQGGNWSKKLTTYLLLIPGDSSGEFWNGKKEGVVANSTSFCCLPARWLLSGGFPPSFSCITLLSAPTPTGTWGCPKSPSWVLVLHLLFLELIVFSPRKPSPEEIPAKGD